jgi:acetolactate synthase small subunit
MKITFYEMEKEKNRSLVSILALNVKGQLGKITKLIKHNNLNILRLVLSAADKDDKVHRTIVYLEGEDVVVENMCKEMLELENVLKVNNFQTGGGYIEKEICLVKLFLDNTAVNKIMELVNEHNGQVIFTSKRVIVFKIEETEEGMNTLVNAISTMTTEVEICRSGIVAVSKEDEIVTI